MARPGLSAGQETNLPSGVNTVYDVVRLYGGGVVIIRSQGATGSDGVYRWSHQFAILATDPCPGGTLTGIPLLTASGTEYDVTGCNAATGVTVNVSVMCIPVP